MQDQFKYLQGLKSDNTRKINKQIAKFNDKNLIYIEKISDGYHTFEDLYYQRCVLFASICNQNRHISWKSKKHYDGEKCFDGNWFIVGIDTPDGSYTYHYEMKYWNMFTIKELENGKEWDGHTEENVTRLLSLGKYKFLKEYIVKIKQENKELKENYEKEAYLVDKLTKQLTDEYKNTEYQTKQKDKLQQENEALKEDVTSLKNKIKELKDDINENYTLKKFEPEKDYGVSRDD